jgi:hypothetical protein
MDFATGILFGRVADMQVTAEEFFADAGVGSVLVRHNSRKRVNHFADRRFECHPGHIRNNATANLAVPLDGCKHRRPFFAGLLGRTFETRPCRR